MIRFTDNWTQLLSHPGSSRWAPGNFVIENYVYFLGGLSTIQLEADMMRFELEPLPSSTNEIATTRIAVSPNPASTVVSILEEDVNQFLEVRLVNNYGQTVQTVVSNQFSVETLA